MRTNIGQLMIIGISGPQLTASEAKFIVDNNIGGIILFDRNLESPQQLRDLCTSIQALSTKMPDKVPLFISIDMEGGRVHRLKPPFTKWPAQKRLGDLDSPAASFDFANMMGKELKAVGINLDFAPCLDILTNPKNTVIGDRAISSDPEMVSKHASALVRGFIKSEIIACAKHFPGHGNTLIDSHEDLPVEDADLKRLQEFELDPFRKAFKSRLDLLMTAHMKFPKIDPEWPVTLSEIFLKNILREDLRYRGLVISDDLDMKALTKKYSREVIAVRALQAGCNILLYCNEPESPEIGLEAIETAVHQGALKKDIVVRNYQSVIALKREKITQPLPLPLNEMIKVIGHPDHQKKATEILEG